MKRNIFLGICVFFMCLPALFASSIIVANRIGLEAFPEDTLNIIEAEVKGNILSNTTPKSFWISVQLSRDNIPVLYRPDNLKDLTDGYGLISEYTFDELQNFSFRHQDNTVGFTSKSAKISSLQEVLQTYPEVHFFINIKSPDADPKEMATALYEAVSMSQAQKRVVFYSLEKDFLDALPHDLNRFKDRHLTHKIIAEVMMYGKCAIKENAEPGDKIYYISDIDERYGVEFKKGTPYADERFLFTKSVMNCFKKDVNNVVMLAGVKFRFSLKRAQLMKADYIMKDYPEIGFRSANNRRLTLPKWFNEKINHQPPADVFLSLFTILCQRLFMEVIVKAPSDGYFSINGARHRQIRPHAQGGCLDERRDPD